MKQTASRSALDRAITASSHPPALHVMCLGIYRPSLTHRKELWKGCLHCKSMDKLAHSLRENFKSNPYLLSHSRRSILTPAKEASLLKRPALLIYPTIPAIVTGDGIRCHCHRSRSTCDLLGLCVYSLPASKPARASDQQKVVHLSFSLRQTGHGKQGNQV